MNVFSTHQQIVEDYATYIRSFLNIADPAIREVVEGELEKGKLWPEPLLQFNPAFEMAGSVADLSRDGTLHRDIADIFKGYSLYRHQVEAIELGTAGKDFIVTSGTGSGKSLTYIGSIFHHLLSNPGSPGVTAVVVYPMNALINSQSEEFHRYKNNYEAGTREFPITFGQYTGQEKEEARQGMREKPPQVLLTNYMMLELLLTRIRERSIRDAIFENLRFLVFDELHTYRGRQGADVAMLIRRIEVHAMNAIGERLYERHVGRPNIASREVIRRLIAEAAVAGQKFNPGFLLTEWEELVDAWQLDSWESYRDVQRLGRKTRLPESGRAALWTVFEAVRARLRAEGLVTRAEMFTRLARELTDRKHPPFDYVVVDESQDLSVPQLRFLAALGADRPNSLFFAGDLGQRIFQQPFSWKSLGVDIRGRARTLHINYRTSHQIRTQTDRLLGPEVSDVDGNTEERRGTVSVFNGPAPVVRTFNSQEEEVDAVGAWLADRGKEGVAPHEIAIFVRSETELKRARAAAAKSGVPFKVLDEHVETTSGQLSICTMHLAKGLEFRAVAVMACDDEIIPLQSRIETVAEDSDLEEVYNTERHLLYVACTRARDHLLVTSVEPASEFLDDLQQW